MHGLVSRYHTQTKKKQWDCFLFYTENLDIQGRNLLLNSKQQKKMIGYRTCFRENDVLDVPLRRGPAIKKKLPFFNVCMLITHRDAQCNTGELP